MSFKSIMATITAVLIGALSTVVAILVGKNKELKRVKTDNKAKDKVIETHEKIATQSAIIEKETNEKIEKIDTGNNVDDFNNCLDLLRNNSSTKPK